MEKKRMKKYLQRGIAFLLAAAMIATSDMGVLQTAFAQEEVTAQTESPAAENQEPAKIMQEEAPPTETDESTVPDEAALPSEGESVRESIDWTQDRASLNLTVERAVYASMDAQGQNQNTVLKSADNKLDLTAVDPSNIQGLQLELGFDFIKAAGERGLQNGDVFAYTIPTEHLALHDTIAPEAIAVMTMNREFYRADDPAANENNHAIGTYTIKNNVITVTLSSEEDLNSLEQLFGVITVQVSLKTETLSTEESVTDAVALQADQIVEIHLPMLPQPEASVEEEETPPSTSEITEEAVVDEAIDEETGSLDQNIATDESVKENESEEVSHASAVSTALAFVRKGFTRFVELLSGKAAEQNYAGGNSYSHIYTTNLPEAFTKVKVKVYNKEGGYQAGDDLRVGFNFGIWMDDDFLYSNFQTITERPDFPAQGSMSDKEYEENVLFPYLKNLSESGEVPKIAYNYNLGDDLNQYNITEPVDLYDASGEHCGYYTIKNGVVTFTFDSSSYYYGNIVASVFMEAELNGDAVSDDPIEEIINKEGEIVHQSIGEIGGGNGTVGDGRYSVEKEGPARVENSEITYTIKATATKDDAVAGDEILNRKQIVDVLPEGLELKEVSLNGKPLSENEYIYDLDTRTLTYTFEALNAEKTNKITSGELKVTVKLNNEKYQQLIHNGSINETFTNKASIKENGKEDPLAVSDEIDTTMKFNFLKKEGSEVGLDGTRYKWTIEANTQLPYLDYGYVADILNWTDQTYDFATGITVYNDKGEAITYKDVPYYEGTAGEWTALTAEKIKAYIDEKGITTPFYYLYDSAKENPFYIEGGTEPKMKQYAVLIIPFNEFAGITEPKSMKIQYFTDMNLHGMTMDQFSEYVREDKEHRNPEIGNAVNLFWKNIEGGIGPGNRLPESVTWDKTVDTNVEALTKKAVAYNAQTQMLTWKMDINRYGASLTDILIEDSLPNATYEIAENGDLTIHCYKYNMNTKEQEGDVVTLAKAKDASQLKDGEYALTSEGTDTKLTIKLPDLLVTGADGKLTAYYYVLDFALKVTDPTLLSTQSSDQTLGNHAKITAKLAGNEFTDVTDAECKIPNILIDKTAVGSYNYQTNKLSWNVTINPNQLPIKNAEITDTLPKGITWDQLTGISVDDVAVASDKFGDYVTVTENKDNTVTLKLKDKDIKETYSFQFDANVTAEWRDAHIKDASDSVVVENKAALFGTVYGGTIDPSTVYDTAKHVIDPVKVSKGGVYDERTGTVSWTVLLNVDQVNLQNMHLVEDLYFGLGENDPKIHALDTDSIQIYEVTLDRYGAVKSETEVSTPDLRDYTGSGNSAPSERGFSFYAPTEKADYATYKITFKTDLLDAATENPDARILNQVYLKNADGSNNETSDSSDGGYDGGFDADDLVTKDKRPKIKLTKSSANSLEVTGDPSLLLDDAEFTITAYSFKTNNNEIILENEIQKYDKVRLTTDGTAVFLNIKATSGTDDLIYMLKETDSPAGYQLNDKPEFVLFTSPTNKGMYTGMTSVTADQKNYPLIIKDADPLKVNYHVINSSGTADDTLAGIVYQDVPVETEFSFSKKILTGVDYKNAGGSGAEYTYASPKEGTVTFKLSPNDSKLNGKVKDQYFTNDATGKFTVKGLDAGTYKLTEAKSADNLSVGAEYALTVSWDGAKYVYKISGNNNKNTYLEKDATGAYTIKDNYVTGDFRFTKVVQYQDEPTNETNPNNNRENLSKVAFTLTSSQIAGKANTTFEATATSDGNGNVSFRNIPVGVYTLTETATQGYEQATTCTVTVEEVADKKTELGTIDGKPVYGKKIQVTYSDETLVSGDRYNNTAIKGTITFTKKAYTDITGLTALNTTLSGAEFGLYRKIGKETALQPTYTATSGLDGVVSFSNVEYGDYVLKEITTPAGYNQAGDIEILRGNLTIETDHSKFSYTVNSADQGIVNNRLIKAGITLTKIDQDGNLLSDRIFNVYRRNNSAIGTDGSGLVVDVPSDVKSYYRYAPITSVETSNQGAISVNNLPYGEYILVEEHKTDQQESDHTAIYVNVTADNNVTIRKASDFAGTKDNGSDYYTAVGDTSKWESVKNGGEIVDALKYGSVQIKKLLAEKNGDALDKTKMPISGVEFKVEKKDASGNYSDYLTLTTNAAGTFTQEGDGTYKDAKDNKIVKHFLYGTYKFTEVTKSGLLVDASKSVEVTFGEGSGEVKHGNTVYLEYDGTADQYETEIVAEKQEPSKNMFYNTAARATISLKKQGEKKEPLNDAIFAVYLKNDSERKIPIATLQEGSNGTYQLSDKNVTAGGGLYNEKREDGVPYLYKNNSSNVYMLLEGEYVIKEVNAPVGYEVFTGEIPFIISQNTDGTVSAKSSNITDVTFKDGQFTVTDHPVELTIEKQDKKDSTKLAGAEFELSSVKNTVETNIKFAKDEAGKYYPDSNGTQTLTTAVEGNLTITKLPVGSYKLVETKAADGYQKLDSTVFATFTVGADGKIEAFTSDSAQYFTAVAASTLITVKNQKNALEFTKLKSDAEGKGLNGAVFTLTPISPTTGNPVSDTAKSVNGKDGIVRFEGIKAGTYTLQETSAPSGYAKSDAVITVIVSGADGSITLKSGETAITKEKLEELFTNTKNSLTITKVFYNAGGTGKVTTPTTLPAFTLYRLEGNVETKWNDATVKDGTAVFNGIPAGSYKLRETSTDSNFIQTTEVHDVVVSADGKVTVDSKTASASGAVTIANYKKAEISFIKKDKTTKTGIAGIDFTLTGTEPEVAAKTINSATDGTVKFTGLNPGEYTLMEGVKASTLGYVKNPETVYVAVSENGTVSYYKDAEYKEMSSDSLDTFFVNQPNQLSVKKTYTKYHDTSAKAENDIAIFELVPTETGKANIVLTANTDGTLYTAERIPEGTYTLKETKTPIGYVAAADIKVVVGADGKITAAGAAGITVTATVTNAIESTEITVKKNWVNRVAELRGAGQPQIQTEAKMTLKVQTKDADGKSILSDAYDCNGNKVESYIVRVSEGNTHTFTNLPKYMDGALITYVIEETRVDGYTVSGLATEANGYTITNTENSLTINKSFIDQNKGGAESEWTTDPTFALTKADGTKINSVMDKTSKKAIFTQIPDGTYTLQEDASDGAYITNATTYTVKVEGGVIAFTDAGENTSGTNVEKSYTNYKLGHFDFTKYMTENGAKKALGGAAFQLTPADTTKKPIEKDSAKNGSVEYTDLQPGDYTLQETKTKAGYAIKTNLITVHVADDGFVTFSEMVDGQSVIRTKSDLEVIFQNEPTNVIIKKLDDNGKAVKGAELKITAEKGKTLANGKESESWTSTDAGWDLTGLITTGVTYTVEETQRVVGNKTAPSAITLKLNADGTLITSGKGTVTGAVVTTDANAATSNTYDAAANTFVMRDVEIRGSVKLTKMVDTQADATDRFGGIEFTLYKSKTEPDVKKTDAENEKAVPAADIAKDTKVQENIKLESEGTVTVDELTEGYYYFVETSTQDGLYLDTTPTEVVYVGPNQHKVSAVGVAKENKNFVTSVTLTKTDAGDVNSHVGKSGDLLEGVTFTLSKKKADDSYTEKQTLSTGKDGKLTFYITEKGTYKVEETATITGYELDSAKPYRAEFTVDNTMDFQKKMLDLSRTYDAELTADKQVIDQYKLKTTNASYAGKGIANTRKSGTVSLKKVDGLNDNALNNVEFELYKKDTTGNMLSDFYKFLTGNTYKQVGTMSWDKTTDSTVNDGVLSISGLSWGDYYIIETNPLPGYVPSDSKYPFTIGANNLEVTLESDTIKHTITNTQTDITFKKIGLVNESCSNIEFNGAPVPEATQIMEGVEFTAYTDAATTTIAKFGNGNAAVATSDNTGTVTFKNLPINQTYYIKETKLPKAYTDGTFHYQLSTTVYKATLDKNGQFTGLTALDDTAVTNNTVVNDVYRTSISFEKVDEKNPDKKLANSIYGLYKLQAAIDDTNKDVGKDLLESKMGTLALDTGSDTVTDENGTWIKIAEAKTDEKGMLTFQGVLTNTRYMVKELVAPDGSYVSEKPMQITFKEVDGKVVIDSIDDGSGTVTVDKDGNIVWLEPQVEVQFAKKDEKGNLLAGAKLEIRNKDGEVVESWISSSSEPYTSYGKLIHGETYTLIESKAPNGYYVAAPVRFTISSDTVGPKQNKVQYVEMIDKKIPDAAKTNRINNPAVKTGDTMTVLPYILLAVAAIAIIIGVIVFRRKKKRDKED